jgi:hypothetical protein
MFSLPGLEGRLIGPRGTAARSDDERFGFEPLGVIKAGTVPEIVPMFEKAALEVRRRSASRRLAILQEIVKVVDPTHSGFLRYE